MDYKSYQYLLYKAHGATKEQIIQAAKLSEDEYEDLKNSFETKLELIQEDSGKASNIGSEFVRLSSYLYAQGSDQQKGIPCPEVIKRIEGESFALPAVGTLEKPTISLYDAIKNRRSIRNYSKEALSLEELSFLLWSACWVKEFNRTERNQFTFRNVPSAGARHSFECYLLINNVQGLKAGLYHYQPIKHILIRIPKEDDIAEQVYEAARKQDMIKDAALNLILTATPYRCTWRYGQRGYRYIYMDAGHVGQNISLACEAIEAGTCMIAAFSDEVMNEILDVNGEDEFVIYIFSVGKKRGEVE